VEGIDRRQNGAGIVHILKFYGFYEVVYVIPWLGASFAKNCGTPKLHGCATRFCTCQLEAFHHLFPKDGLIRS
jgi:hypothetical protein